MTDDRAIAEHLSSRLTLEPTPDEMQQASDLILAMLDRQRDLEAVAEAARRLPQVDKRRTRHPLFDGRREELDAALANLDAKEASDA